MDNPAATPRSAPPTTLPDQSGPDGSSPRTDDTDADGTQSAGPPPTTALLPRPSGEDIELLAFAQSFELTARDLYQTAIGAGAGGDHAAVFTTLMENHEEYGNVIAGIIGTDAPQQRDDAIYDQFVDGFDSSDTAAVAEAGYDLESIAVATHIDLVGQLTGLDGSTVLAALLVVEARHCTVLAHIAGRGEDMDAVLENMATALSPSTSAED